MVAVVDVDKSRINSPSSSLHKAVMKTSANPFHLIGDPLRSISMLVKLWSGDLGAATSLSPANFPTMQAKRMAQRTRRAFPSLLWRTAPRCSQNDGAASLGAAALLVSDILPLSADESHGNCGRDGEIDAAALLVSGNSLPHLPQIWRIW